jgi:hypothetical protein
MFGLKGKVKALLMIKEISQRIYSAAAVCPWVVVVTATSAVILASTVNGGISW